MAWVETAETEERIRACFPVLVQLRPQLRADEFVDRVRLQVRQGYRLALVNQDGRAAAVAGFRVGDNLAWGRFLYVDDLVTDEACRSQGHGKLLLDWLVDQAREAGCQELHLDSGVQRYAAHRFYLTQRMEIRSHHFSLVLG